MNSGYTKIINLTSVFIALLVEIAGIDYIDGFTSACAESPTHAGLRLFRLFGLFQLPFA